MARADKHFALENRRVTKTQLIKVAQERFGLTKNAAEAACSEVLEQLSKEAGHLPKIKRVALEELRAIE